MTRSNYSADSEAWNGVNTGDEPEEQECKRCHGLGEDRDGADCRFCDGYGSILVQVVRDIRSRDSASNSLET